MVLDAWRSLGASRLGGWPSAEGTGVRSIGWGNGIGEPSSAPSALVGVAVSFWVSVRPDATPTELVLPSGQAQIVVDGDRGRSSS